MDINIWNEFCRVQWNLSELYKLLKSVVHKSMIVPINSQIKIITIALYISQYLYIPAEIWIIIQNMSKHMQSFKPKEIFLHDAIQFECNKLDLIFDDSKSFEVGRLGNLGLDNNYMIINIDDKNEIIQCVFTKVICHCINSHSFYTIIINLDSPIKVYTWDEFNCSQNRSCSYVYDFPQSLINKDIFHKPRKFFIKELSFKLNDQFIDMYPDDSLLPNKIYTANDGNIFNMIIEIDAVHKIVSYIELYSKSNQMIIHNHTIKWCTCNEFINIYKYVYDSIYDVVGESMTQTIT
jgi:hypothetical protein